MGPNVRAGARGARILSWHRADAGLSDLSAQLVLDMRADDVIECGFDLEAERDAAARVEAARPAGDNARDQFIRRAADALGDTIAGDALERGNLLADGA